MRDDIKKLKKYMLLSLGVVILILIICPPLVRLIIFSIHGESMPLLDSAEIMSFSGSVIGGSLGGITALLAIYFTLKYYKEKDELMRNEGIYGRQIERIEMVARMIKNREIIPYDSVNTFRLSETLLQKISDYNDLTCNLKGFYTEYAVSLLQVFQDEYDGYPDERCDKEGNWIERSVSVIGFLNLKEELRDCAERIGKLALYENARELLHGDPRISYILESEAGGSAGLWAGGLHDKNYAFRDDDYHYDMLLKYFPLIETLLIGLEEFKEIEYRRIVLLKDDSIAPVCKLKKECINGSFLCGENIVIEHTNSQK